VGIKIKLEEFVMNIEKIKAAFSEEAFVKALAKLETAAEVQAALKEKGVELSEEESAAILDLILKVKNGEITREQFCKAEDGELDDEQLEKVAGGFVIHIIVGIGSVGIGIANLINWLTGDDD
jgi:hypothetical protein